MQRKHDSLVPIGEVFGAHPANADKKYTVRNVRTKCLRELNYMTAPGLLILHPLPPVIPQSITWGSGGRSAWDGG